MQFLIAFLGISNNSPQKSEVDMGMHVGYTGK
jgi:hypothetical protein